MATRRHAAVMIVISQVLAVAFPGSSPYQRERKRHLLPASEEKSIVSVRTLTRWNCSGDVLLEVQAERKGAGIGVDGAWNLEAMQRTYPRDIGGQARCYCLGDRDSVRRSIDEADDSNNELLSIATSAWLSGAKEDAQDSGMGLVSAVWF
ncbi:hypothetical protein E6O75_ATG08343 [Venturia nashicola]|uniref:Uncharacterized protein n=1 Tax=Venturia nashicola TaxID=86259 RepID=A0A4Z1P4F1_9PEZI|nr:hypothetical protein E6O75_ATG08343 [Venturia nashicola]